MSHSHTTSGRDMGRHVGPMHTDQVLKDVNILGPLTPDTKKILSKEALVFLAVLHRTFNGTRKALLQRRIIRQQELDKGNTLDFLPETRHIRENDAWKGALPAPGLVDRRIEITGPTDRKMVVNALNSDVWTYMADFEGESRREGGGMQRRADGDAGRAGG